MPPQVFGDRYELIQPIARGGMAEVYAARDRLLDRPVAVKVLHPEFARDPSFIERFRREARAAANLSHPNIVSVYDWGNQDGTYFLVMEYIQGRSLQEILRSEGRVAADRATRIAAESAAALGAAHRAGLVHRDVKPANIMLTPTGQGKVMDFGIARTAGTHDNLTQTGAVIGTATYFSPEQAQGKALDGRSDVYSLGVVLYEMLTGRTPFVGESPVAVAYKHVTEAPQPPRQFNPGISRELEAVVMRALAKDPAYRYQSAEEFQSDLERVLAGVTPLALAPPGGRPVAATTIMMDGRARAAQAATRPAATVPAAPAAYAQLSQVPPPQYTQPVAYTSTQPTYSEQIPDRRSPVALVLGLGLLAIALVVAIVVLANVWGAAGDNNETTTTTVPLVELPDFSGRPVADVQGALDDLGLLVQVTSEINGNFPADTVIRTEPAAGSNVQVGSLITLVISGGAGNATVPNVVGLTQADAEAALANANLTVGEVIQEPSPDVVAGAVIRSNPFADSILPAGGTVTLVVSSGPEQVQVPEVTGANADDAETQLETLGLQVQVIEEPSDTVPVGTVIGTDPAAGTTVTKGQLVALRVSTGPEMVAVPNLVGRTQSDAEAALQELGLVSQVTTVAGDASSDQLVVAHNPTAGTMVAKGSTVVLSVAIASTPPSS